jgi:hypothetical protein
MESHLLAIASEKTMTPIKKSLQFGWEEFLKDPWMYILYSAIAAGLNFSIYFLFDFLGHHLFGECLLIILGLPLQLGIAIYYYKKNNINENHFKHFFDGFFKTFELLKFFIIVIIGILLLMIPLFFTVVIAEVGKDIVNGVGSNGKLSWLTEIAVILYTPIIIFIAICIMLSPYFIYFFKLKALESIKMSYRFVKPRWWSYLRFYLTLFFLGIIGQLLIMSFCSLLFYLIPSIVKILIAVSILGMIIISIIISLAMMHQFFTVTKMKVRKEDGTEAVLDGLVEV